MCEGPGSSGAPDASALQHEPLIQALEREQGSACLLSTDLSILYVNGAWRAFAAQNGVPELARATCLGGRITDFISEPLREFFRIGFQRVLQQKRVWTHMYECS